MCIQYDFLQKLLSLVSILRVHSQSWHEPFLRDLHACTCTRTCACMCSLLRFKNSLCLCLGSIQTRNRSTVVLANYWRSLHTSQFLTIPSHFRLPSVPHATPLLDDRLVHVECAAAREELSVETEVDLRPCCGTASPSRARQWTRTPGYAPLGPTPSANKPLHNGVTTGRHEILA